MDNQHCIEIQDGIFPPINRETLTQDDPHFSLGGNKLAVKPEEEDPYNYNIDLPLFSDIMNPLVQIKEEVGALEGDKTCMFVQTGFEDMSWQAEDSSDSNSEYLCNMKDDSTNQKIMDNQHNIDIQDGIFPLINIETLTQDDSVKLEEQDPYNFDFRLPPLVPKVVNPLSQIKEEVTTLEDDKTCMFVQVGLDEMPVQTEDSSDSNSEHLCNFKNHSPVAFQEIKEAEALNSSKCIQSSKDFNEKLFLKDDPFTPGGSALKCCYCHREFTRKFNLKRHLLSHSGASLLLFVKNDSCDPSGEGAFNCNYCRREFTRKSNLKRHLLSHSGTKPFQCTHCKMSFIRKLSLQKHLAVHSSDNNFTCRRCRKKFAQESLLKDHSCQRSRDKLFQCNFCNKNFTDRSNLNRHLFIHSGDKPFQCDQCSKSFNRQAHLKNHLILHSGDKPFACSHCGKCFAQKSNLNDHLRIHSREKPFKCKYCDRDFVWKSSLQKHLRSHCNKT